MVFNTRIVMINSLGWTADLFLDVQNRKLIYFSNDIICLMLSQFPIFEVLVRFFIKRFIYPFCVIYHHCSQRLMTFEYYKDQNFYNYFRFSKIFIRRWYNDNNIGAWAILVYKKFDILANVKCLDISCILTQTRPRLSV